MREPWVITLSITKACPTIQTSCTASTRGLRELCPMKTSLFTWTSTLMAGESDGLFWWIELHRSLVLCFGSLVLFLVPKVTFSKTCADPLWIWALGTTKTNWSRLDLQGLQETHTDRKLSASVVCQCVYTVEKITENILRMFPLMCT